MIGFKPHLGAFVLQGAGPTLTARLLASTPWPAGVVLVIDPEARPFDDTLTIAIAKREPIDWSFRNFGNIEAAVWDDYSIDNSLKARRRRFQEFTRSLCGEAGHHGIRAAGKKWKTGRRARSKEQRTRTKA